jgi:hypothetical protein
MKSFPEEERVGHQCKPSYRKTYLDDIIEAENRDGRPGPGNYFRVKKETEEDKKQ